MGKCAFVFLFLGLVVPVCSGQPWVISSVTGEVYISTSGSWTPALSRSSLPPEGKILTGPGGRIQLTGGQTQMEIFPLSLVSWNSPLADEPQWQLIRGSAIKKTPTGSDTVVSVGSEKNRFIRVAPSPPIHDLTGVPQLFKEISSGNIPH